MSMTINTAARAATIVPSMSVPGVDLVQEAAAVQAKAARTVQMAAGAVNLMGAYAKVKESRAKAREMLAQAEVLEAKAELADVKADLEKFIRSLEEKIRFLEKLLTKEGDDVQAEKQLEENVSEQLASSIEEMAEETERLVAGFEPRREEILNEKRGIEA